MVQTVAPVAVSFYDQVLREILAAVGAALFLGNLLALVRHRRGGNARREEGDLEQAPRARTITYLVIGFVVMVWGLGSLIVAD